MVIKASSARAIDALVADLASPSAVTRDAAVARLTVIGARAVGRLATVIGQPDSGGPARVAALRALEAIGDVHALNAALKATSDGDPAVALAAVAVVRAFLLGPHGAVALDRLTAIALDRGATETVRLAVIRALRDLDRSTLGPLWKLLQNDSSPAIRAQAGRSQSSRSRGPSAAAEFKLPDDPLGVRQMLSIDGGSVPLPVIHRIVERTREQEAGEPENRRAEWMRARAAAHVALANRGSRLALYDLRESLESTRVPLPVEFLAALKAIGDVSCLEAIAIAHQRVNDDWWREHLVDAFRAIVRREHVTRRHTVWRKIQQRWPGLLSTL